MSIIAIIPARAGSKRLRNKNILPLKGKPLIAYTIEASKEAKIFDRICVSTDSDSIIQITKSMELDVPFKRPDFLSGDKSSSIDVVLHALDFCKKYYNEDFDYVCLLQPTSPLRTAEDITNSYKFFKKKAADSIVSVTIADHPEQFYGHLGMNDEMTDFVSNLRTQNNSQNSKEYFRLNGAIYIIKVDVLRKQRTFYLYKKCFGYRMKKENSIDIDDIFDFRIAEYFLSIRDKV